MPVWGKVSKKCLKQFYKESCHCSFVKMPFYWKRPSCIASTLAAFTADDGIPAEKRSTNLRHFTTCPQYSQCIT